MEYLALACRCAVGLVFAASALSKLRSAEAFRSFTQWLGTVPGMRTGAQRPIAAAMAAAEVGVLVLVVIPYTGVIGMTAAAVLLAVFAAGSFAVVRAGDAEPCQCFGPSSTPLGPRHVGRNVALCAVAALGAAAVGPVPAGYRVPLIAVSVCAGFAAALVAIFLDDIAAIAAGPAAGQEG